ncbi:MAG: hypothetical protein ACLR2D_11575 [Anaerobutyricum hallii]
MGDVMLMFVDKATMTYSKYLCFNIDAQYIVRKMLLDDYTTRIRVAL